jgi:peptidoglycan/xylan/chitin deacetylase (PgdA/CDA1 family)
MSQLKKLFYQSCSFLPMQFLQKRSPITTLFPYHHTVSNEGLPHIQHLYSYKNEHQFKEDLEVLLKYNNPISAEDLTNSLRENKSFPKKTFLLTFDDGFRETHDVIAPLLEEKGIPAVFFINPDFINNNALFLRCKTSLLIHELVNAKNADTIKQYRSHFNLPGASQTQLIETLKGIKVNNPAILDDLAIKTGYSFSDFLKTQQPYLTTAQLLSLKERGFTIGAHSMNHPYYNQLSLKEQIEQTLQSCNYVTEQTGMAGQYFSFPFSDEYITQKLLDELNKTQIDLLFGLQNQKKEIENKMVHRFNAERSFIKFEKQLKGILFMSIVNEILGKNDVHRN